jgi:hypothetical protein
MAHPNAKRIPIHRPRHYFTPDALAVFSQMQNLEIEKPPHWRKRWHALSNQLHEALDLMPWQIPAVLHPDEPVTETTDRHRVWTAERAKSLYRALAAAASAQRAGYSGFS